MPQADDDLTTTVGVGTAPTAEDSAWESFAESTLGPKSVLQNSASLARYIVATSVLLAGLFTGFGLTMGSTYGYSSRRFVIAGGVFSLLCILTSLLFLLLRSKIVAPGNIEEVKAWFNTQTKSVWLLSASSLFLVLQTACIPLALISQATSTDAPRYSFQFLPSAQGSNFDGFASFSVSCHSCSHHQLQMQVVSEETRQNANGRDSVFYAIIEADTAGSIQYTSPSIRFTPRDRIFLTADNVEVLSIPTR